MLGLVLGYARSTPHDQYFYDKPREMIAGEVPAPAMSLGNRDVIIRHLFAIVFGAAEPGLAGRMLEYVAPKGEVVQAVVLDIDPEKERISLGMKQLERGGPVAGGVAAAGDRLNKNQVVTVTVLEVRDAGLEVQAGDDGATGFIKRTDLGRDRDEQRPERFQVGQKFDAMVTGFDRSKKPTFSVKAMQIAEEKQAVAQYGSSDSGASLGDILGEALKARTQK